mgnify:CR=1 FL=1
MNEVMTEISKPIGIIYMARNLVNGKVYIGQTWRTLAQRKSKHFSDSKRNKAAKELGLDRRLMGTVLEGRRKELQGWRFYYV